MLSSPNSKDILSTVPEFCRKIGCKKPDLANDLYEMLIDGKENDYSHIIPYLLIGLYQVEPDSTFTKVRNLINTKPATSYVTIGMLFFSKKEHILESFEIADNVDKFDVDCLLRVPFIYKSLIENTNTPDEIKDKCFSNISNLFDIENKELRNTIFNSCRFIKGYEEIRYKILVDKILLKTQDYYKNISEYFSNYSDPKYFFELFEAISYFNYKNKIQRPQVEIFTAALSHFWNIKREQTEEVLLDLLSHDSPYLRIGAVDLIRSNHNGCYGVNLLSLNSDIKQLRAIEAFLFRSYYKIEDLLPLILPLADSIFENVISYLQEKLSLLIFDSYHDYLYEQIVKLTQDESFLAPLKENLDAYHKYCELKASVNDLNPRKNEYNLMDLYYSLHNERYQKMMHEIRSGNNSFLSTIKNTTIVRGHSFKVDDNEVTSLGEIRYSYAIDSKMYKNPDLYDHEHDIFKSEF